ncbi:hypothetical protein BT93_D1410 [Corymbia citriodora subsp. variegata]|nr:hypothetical protein BT93_D1410 [Corymbia citriodora subsp. variegata]
MELHRTCKGLNPGGTHGRWSGSDQIVSHGRWSRTSTQVALNPSGTHGRWSGSDQIVSHGRWSRTSTQVAPMEGGQEVIKLFPMEGGQASQPRWHLWKVAWNGRWSLVKLFPMVAPMEGG